MENKTNMSICESFERIGKFAEIAENLFELFSSWRKVEELIEPERLDGKFSER